MSGAGEGRHDVHVFVDPAVPKVFEDAYAVDEDGRLKVYRWSTRHAPKVHPIAEFNEHCWSFFQHMGGQGDETLDAVKASARERAAAKKAPDGSHAQAADAASWSPREEEIRSREPGVLQDLSTTQVRPAIPPTEFATPTSRLPQRVPHSGDVTEVLPAVPELGTPNDQPPAQKQAARTGTCRRSRLRRTPGTGEAWSLGLALFIGVMTFVLR